MDPKVVEKIQKANTSAQIIDAARLCAEEALSLLSDLIVCYESGVDPEQLNIIYGDAVELTSLWRNNTEKAKSHAAYQRQSAL